MSDNDQNRNSEVPNITFAFVSRLVISWRADVTDDNASSQHILDGVGNLQPFNFSIIQNEVTQDIDQDLSIFITYIYIVNQLLFKLLMNKHPHRSRNSSNTNYFDKTNAFFPFDRVSFFALSSFCFSSRSRFFFSFSSSL